nr:hypothetical protein Iba_scaffold44222CG0030 [Ipomoea batatas]GME08568.1 hypothetical protein Iba_scaffold7794CG0010 [Ipomoea batatas]
MSLVLQSEAQLHWFAEQHPRQRTASLLAANFDKREGEKRGKASPPPNCPAAGASPRRFFFTQREKSRLCWYRLRWNSQLAHFTIYPSSTLKLCPFGCSMEMEQRSPACFTRCRTDGSAADDTSSMAEEAIPDADSCTNCVPLTTGLPVGEPKFSGAPLCDISTSMETLFPTLPTFTGLTTFECAPQASFTVPPLVKYID